MSQTESPEENPEGSALTIGSMRLLGQTETIFIDSMKANRGKINSQVESVNAKLEEHEKQVEEIKKNVQTYDEKEQVINYKYEYNYFKKNVLADTKRIHKITYDSGIYTGQITRPWLIKYGKYLPDGIGKMEYKDKDTNMGEYMGEWLNGYPHGVGKYTYANGDTYIGELSRGYPNGVGNYKYKNPVCLKFNHGETVITKHDMVFHEYCGYFNSNTYNGFGYMSIDIVDDLQILYTQTGTNIKYGIHRSIHTFGKSCILLATWYRGMIHTTQIVDDDHLYAYYRDYILSNNEPNLQKYIADTIDFPQLNKTQFELQPIPQITELQRGGNKSSRKKRTKRNRTHRRRKTNRR
jgi:hypothetical protein